MLVVQSSILENLVFFSLSCFFKAMPWTQIAFGAVVGAGIGVGAVLAAPVVLPVIGFSSTGVLAGSMAATAQAAIGNVAAGSVFATLQSIGAVGGLSWTATGAVTAAGSVAGAVTGAAAQAVGGSD